MMEVAVIDLLNEESLRAKFEALANDSYGFKRSAKGTYVNGSTARDWKWFKLGIAAASERSGKAADDAYKEVGSFLYEGAVYVATSSDDPRGIKLYTRPAGNSSAAPSEVEILRRKNAGLESMLTVAINERNALLAAPAPTGESLSVRVLKEVILDICDTLILALEYDAAEQSGARQCKNLIEAYLAAKESA